MPARMVWSLLTSIVLTLMIDRADMSRTPPHRAQRKMALL